MDHTVISFVVCVLFGILATRAEGAARRRPGQCLDKWHYFQGHCYRVFDVHLREWHAARAMYKYEAGDLVKIDSAEEQDFLITIFPEWNNVWIGMSRGRDKKFYWRWGEKPTYTNWGRGEPNDASVLEDCLEMRRDGKWNDLQCRRRLYGLCEKKALS